MSREVLQQALEALNSGEDAQIGRVVWTEYDSSLVQEAITAIEAALAQPEPVACPYCARPLIKCKCWGEVQQVWKDWSKSRLDVHDDRFAMIAIDNIFTKVHAALVAPPKRQPETLFAVSVAARKWKSLQDEGYKMQQLSFARDGKTGTIDAWGKVLWEPDQRQTEQEPVGFVVMERQPLTDERIDDIWAGCSDPQQDSIDMHEFARAIEAAHGIGEKK